MKMHSVLFAAAAIGASAMTVGLAVAPAQAAPNTEVVVTGRITDAPTALVRYGDLNLASHAGRARLDRRVGLAARKLCGTYMTQEHNAARPVRACQSAVFASAKPQVEAVIAAYDNGQRLALGDTGAFTLSAK